MGEIYVITSRTSGKSYVGQTVSALASGKSHGTLGRWRRHVHDSVHTNQCPALSAAIRKYGESDFSVETLLFCDVDDLDLYEERFIKQYGSLSPNGYNLTTGGGGSAGRTATEETRSKMSFARQNVVYTTEMCAKISAGLKSMRKHKPAHREILDTFLSSVGLTILPPSILYLASYNGRGDGFTVRLEGHPKKSFGKSTLTLRQKFDLAVEHLKLISTTAVGEDGSASSSSSQV